MTQETEAKAIAALASASQTPGTIGTTPMVIVPEGYAVQNLESLLPAPTRKRGTVTLRDVASFITLVKQECTLNSRIYGRYDPPSFTAVLNDNSAAPGWQDHKAVFACPLSVEWKTWSGSDGSKMDQTSFAQFVENNLPDIAQPPAADMLEISRTLEAKKKVNFASGIRLSNGQNQLTYEEQISGTAAKGQIQVPEEFTIGIPVLEGGPKYAVTARLRYRILEGGKMQMWFELVRPHKIIEDAVKEVWHQIAQETGLTMLNGGI
jgi:uncharacterized protein YfdQ (DUF2303 family)